MLSSFGSDMAQLIKFAAALIIIFVVVGTFVLILRRMTGGRLISSEPERSRSRQPRLGIVDVYDLDRTRQLVLLRRDNVEHLLLIGGPNDTVIETNIVRMSATRSAPPVETLSDRNDHIHDRSQDHSSRLIAEQPTRPVFESGGVFRQAVEEHIAPPAEPYGEKVTAHIEPQYEAPATPAGGNPASHAAIAAASYAAVAAATQYGQEIAETSEATEAAVPEFLRSQRNQRYQETPLSPPASPDFPPPPPPAAISAPKLPEPEPARTGTFYDQAFQPASRPTLPPLDAASRLPEAPVAETPATEVKDDSSLAELDAAIGEYVQSLPSHSFGQEEETAPEPAPVAKEDAIVTPESSNTLHLDDSMLSDVARELEEALKSSHPPAPVAEPVESKATPTAETPAENNDAMDSFADIDRAINERLTTKEEPAAPKEAPAAAAAEAGKSSPDGDPFSLDDIEAEFARLLGRGQEKKS